MTHRPLRPMDTSLLNRAFDQLLGWAAANVADSPEGEGN
jgi:molecular chaperone HtpG